jgi:hypothetical protein
VVSQEKIEMKKRIDGRLYLMRDQRPLNELRRLHKMFREKYRSQISFHDWLCERGKVALEIVA